MLARLSAALGTCVFVASVAACSSSGDESTAGFPDTTAAATFAATSAVPSTAATTSSQAASFTSVVTTVPPPLVVDATTLDPAAALDPMRWLATIDVEAESFTIYRVASARAIAPDEAELRIDRYVGAAFVSAEDLRGPEFGSVGTTSI